MARTQSAAAKAKAKTKRPTAKSKDQVASFTVSGDEQLIAQVRKGMEELFRKLDLPRPDSLGGDIGRWEQSGGWYLDNTGGGWSQSGGWVLDLKGKKDKFNSRPTELVLQDVQKVLEKVKAIDKVLER
jgi:hypothetical protein